MKAILFDLDGTLIDSSRGIKNGFAHTFKKLGIPFPDEDTLRTFIGPPLEDTFKRYLTSPSEIDKAVKIYREFYKEQGAFEASVYPDIPEFLADLKKSGYQIYVTSSKLDALIPVILKAFNLDSYFTGLYGHTNQRPNKTEVIKACLTAENISSEDAVIIGDTSFDMIGGKNVGIATIGVTWGFGLEAELRTAGADYICQTTQDIKTLGIL